jgi:uncharacterized protein YdeI (YjbR/CyaY-like superfamily)
MVDRRLARMGKAKRDLPVIAFKSQQAWDAWLKSQPAQAKGLWLKLAKQSSGIASVSKPEALIRRFVTVGSMANSTVSMTNIG